MCRHGENIYKRKDGRYEGRYIICRNSNGKTKYGYIYGKSYHEVRTKLITKKHELGLPTTNTPWKAKGTIMLKDHCAKWLSGTVLFKVKPSTYASYCRIFKTHVYPLIGFYYLSEITPEVMMNFIVQLQNKGLSDGTIKLILSKLSSVMKVAIENGLISANPCRMISYQDREYKSPKLLSSADRQSLIAALTEDDLPILFAIMTGARLGEVCGMKWTDIDWSDRTVTINRTVSRLPSQGTKARTTLMIGATKSKQGHRKIPLCDQLFTRLKARHDKSEGDYIFGKGKCTSPMDPRTLQRKLKEAATRAGVKDIHFHMLRHDFITRLVTSGVDTTAVRDIAGHKSTITTLDFYVHPSLEGIRESITKSMDSSFSPS